MDDPLNNVPLLLLPPEDINIIFHHMPVMMWTYGPLGLVNFYNNKWYEYTGLSLEQKKVLDWKKLVHPDDLEITVNTFLTSLHAGKIFEIENRIIKSDGTYRWHLSRSLPIRDTNKIIQFWVGTITDIHDTKTTSRELKRLQENEKFLYAKAESERLSLYNLIMQIPAGMCTLQGPSHIFEIINPEYQKLVGLRKIAGKTIREALPELEGQGIFELLDTVYRTGKPVLGNEIGIDIARNENSTVEKIYFNFIYQARIDAAGEIYGIIVFAYEVTELVKARKMAEQSAEQFKTLSNSLPQIVWTASADGLLDYFNDQWYSFSGATYEHSAGEGWAEYIHPYDIEYLSAQWKDSLSKGHFYQVEARIKNKEGNYKWFLIRALPLLNSKGKIDHWFGTCTEIEDQKQSEQKLQKITYELEYANKEIVLRNKKLTIINNDLDSFIYTASHDLRAPISNLEGLLQAYVEVIENKEYMYLIEMMFQSIERFKTTIKDLTEITHAQKGEFEDVHLINIREMFNDVQLDLKELVQKKQAEIHCNFEVTDFYFSRKNFRSIIYNLFSNALKYSSEDRRLQVFFSTIKEGDFIVLTVKDNGLGINDRGIHKIFGMFKRLHSHTEGTGIGLYMVKRIIENAGGKIEVHSVEGSGSTFAVYFPLKINQ